MSTKRHQNLKAGFSLVEVLIAIAVVAMSFLVTYGLIAQAVGQMSRVCGEQKATEIMSKMVGDVSTAVKSSNTSNTLTASPLYNIPLPVTSGGSLTADSAAPYYFFDTSGTYVGNSATSTAAYRATIGMIKVSATPSNVSIYQTHVVVYWPADMDPTVGHPTSSDLVTQISN